MTPLRGVRERANKLRRKLDLACVKTDREDFCARNQVREWELDQLIKSASNRWIKKVRMVRRSDKKLPGRPPVKLEKQHGDKSFEFADVRGVIPMLSKSVKLVDEYDCLLSLGVLKLCHQVLTAAPEKTRQHHRRFDVNQWKAKF